MEIINSGINYLDSLSLLVCLKKNIFNKYHKNIKKFIIENQGFPEQRNETDASDLEANIQYYIDNIYCREYLHDTKKNSKKNIFFSIYYTKHITDNKIEKNALNNFYVVTDILKHVLIQHFEILRYKMLNSVMHLDNMHTNNLNGYWYIRCNNKYYKKNKAQLLKKINPNELIDIKDIINSFETKYTKLTSENKKQAFVHIISSLNKVAIYIYDFYPVYPIMKIIYRSIIRILLFCAQTPKIYVSEQLSALLFQNINFSLSDILALDKYYILSWRGINIFPYNLKKKKSPVMTDILAGSNYYLFRSCCFVSKRYQTREYVLNLCASNDMPIFIFEILVEIILNNFGLMANFVFLQDIVMIFQIIKSNYLDCNCFTNTKSKLFFKNINEILSNKYQDIIKLELNKLQPNFEHYNYIYHDDNYFPDDYNKLEFIEGWEDKQKMTHRGYMLLLSNISIMNNAYPTSKLLPPTGIRCSWLRDIFLKTKCNMCRLNYYWDCGNKYCVGKHNKIIKLIYNYDKRILNITHNSRGIHCQYCLVYEVWADLGDCDCQQLGRNYQEGCHCSRCYEDAEFDIYGPECELPFFEKLWKQCDLDNFINSRKKYNMRHQEITHKRKLQKKIYKLYSKNNKINSSERMKRVHMFTYDKIKNYKIRIINGEKCLSIINRTNNHRKTKLKKNLMKQINNDTNDYYLKP